MKSYFVYLSIFIGSICLPLFGNATSDPPSDKLEQLKKIFPNFDQPTFMDNSDCPDIEIVDLRNIPGFSQLDDLTVCGAADTLSLIIYSGALGDIKGFAMELDLPEGVNYAGWEHTDNKGTGIFNTDPSTTKPEFNITGFDGDSLIVVNIGLSANCDVNILDLLLIDFAYEFTYIDTFGVLHECTGMYTPPIEYNSAIHTPVLNVLSPLAPEVITMTSVGGEFCQDISISQDGIASYVDSFTFDIQGLAIGDGFNINSITANGTHAVSSTYNAATMTTSMLIDGGMFVGNRLANPDDTQFNTNEIIDITVCYSIDNCPEGSDLPFTYVATYGCEEQACQSSSQTSTILIQPVGSLMPTATTTLVSSPFVCGADGEVSVTITNPNTDTDQNKYTDVSAGFETCETENLALTQVMVGTTLLPISTFSWVGDDLLVDFSALPAGVDIDGTGGLEDLDGDGVFDDLAGGASLTLSMFLGVECGVDIPDPSSSVCPSNDCPFTQFYISGSTNCGNAFKSYPTGISGFSITHGATAVSNPNEYGIPTASPNLSGYDFGNFGDLGTATTPNPTASTQEVIFCYDFASENFNNCTDNEIFLQITFSGSEGYIYDIDLLSAELSVDGGANYTTTANLATDTSWINMGIDTRQLQIALGSTAANVCYKYVLEMDSTWCPPPAYWFGSQQVLERCNDVSCGPDGCDMVRACRTATFYGNAEHYDCICPIKGDLRELYRKNYGYTDATKTTQVKREDVSLDDQIRFLPCDTMVVDYYYIITDQHLLDNVEKARLTLEQWYTGNTPYRGSIIGAELMPNPSSNELIELSVQKVGVPYADRQILDLSDLSECVGYGFNHGFEKIPWEGGGHITGCSNSSVDVYDGTFTRFVLYNYGRIDECRGYEVSGGGGDCLDEFFATTNYAAGDTIRIKYSQEMMKNPYRQAYISAGLDPGPASEDHTINVTAYIDMIDENGGGVCNTRAADDCAVNPVYKGTCPGFVSSISEVNLDACGGSIEHTFYMNPEIPIDWFTDEFRPVFNIQNIIDPLYAPMAYCGDGEVINYANGIPMSIPISPDSTNNLFCVSVTGYADDVCGIESGTQGKLIWNPKNAGAMALGLGNVAMDSLTIKYDFCLTCPELINVLDYQMVYDYGYMCETIPEDCHYLCSSTDTDEICNIVPGVWINDIKDSLFNSLGNLGPNVAINDTRTPIAPATTELGLGASDLLASGSPGISEEIQAIDICNPDLTETATGVGASITIPISVRLEDVYSDAGGTTPLTWSLISDNGLEKIYSVTLPSETFAPEECTTIYVGTTLLYCPDPTDLPPTICVSTISGCGSMELRAALSAAAGCGITQACYAYISGEVGLQTEWFDFPVSPQLCEEMTFNVRVKNVKQLILLDLIPEFIIPPGLTIVPGSWEVSYPGGPTTFGTYTSIPNPDIVSGNSYSYSDDLLWSSVINSTGLEGVSVANATEDENKVAFRFKATTNCNEFLSGSKLQTETLAADPCSDALVSSGIVDSPPLIINGANPSDNAQLLVIADPEELNCMATVNTFGITALNTSDNPTSDSVHTCITLPESLQYIPNSAIVIQPAGYTIASELVTVIGTSTEICFVSPPIGISQAMKVEFDAAVDVNAACGDVPVLVDIKSVVDAVTCSPGPPSNCSVFVQNSLNPSINIEIKPPFIADDLVVYTDCSTDPSTMDLYYEWTINHNGPTASNQSYTVNFYEDVDGDQSVNSNVDNLLGTENGTFSVADGSAIIVSGNILVAADQSCPVLFEVIYNTSCTCDREEKYFNNIATKALRDYTEPIAMCPGECFDIEVCDFVSVSSDSLRGATGIEYKATLNWNKADSYTLPSGGPTMDFTTYKDLTDNSVGNGDYNLLFPEQSAGFGDAYIVASYPYPVQVERIYMGGGDVTGWNNVIHVYGGRILKLEYSDDGTNWTLAETGAFLPTSAIIEETVLAEPVVAQYFRVSSEPDSWNWGTSEFRLEGAAIPFEGSSPVTKTGSTVSICLPDGVGIDAPWEVDFTTGTGNCEVTESIEIWNVGASDFTIEGDDFACGTACISLEVTVPNDATTGMTVQWAPSTMVDDPSAFEVEICNLTESVTFEATVTYNDGACSTTLEYPVTYYPNNTINISPNEIECYVPFSAPILTADAGWDMYAWYETSTGNEFLTFSSFSNIYIAPGPGTYIVKASSSTSQCPAISTTVVVPDNVCCEEVCLPVNVTLKRGD